MLREDGGAHGLGGDLEEEDQDAHDVLWCRVTREGVSKASVDRTHPRSVVLLLPGPPFLRRVRTLATKSDTTAMPSQLCRLQRSALPVRW